MTITSAKLQHVSSLFYIILCTIQAMHGSRRQFRLLEQTVVTARKNIDMYLERIEMSSEITRSDMDITNYEYSNYLIAV